jgi:ABC-type transport system involved in multi-copper enzyme maturation permease subunit
MNKAFAIAGVVIKEMYRRKDFYVLLVLTALITLVLGSVNFFNDPKIVRYLKEVCLLLVWISALVIAIGTAARQIPAERENRTIFPLLAKPVTRWHVILGKFLGCWFACGIALVVFYLFFGLVSGGRASDAAAPVAAVAGATNVAAADEHAGHDSHEGHVHDGDGHGHDDHADHEAKSSALTNYVQAVWLHWMMLGIVTAIVLFGSIVFSAPSANTTISFIGVLGILLLGEHLHKVALRQTEPVQTILSVIYFAIPHLEWFDIRDRVIYDHSPVAWGAMGLASLYAAAYTGLFLFAAWMLFRRKALNT